MMKNTLGLIALSSIFVLASCSNEPAPAATVQPAPAPATVQPAPTKEVIVVKQEPVIVVKEETPAKPTTITLNKNGVKVGTKKVQIDINRDNK